MKRKMTLSEFEFNGETALKAVLACTPYKTLEQAVASLTLFTHPKIVSHTKNKALFRIRKMRGNEKRGDKIKLEKVVVCDNQSPTQAFLWANQIKGRPQEVQFNHLYPRSGDPGLFTSLANICVTPAFLAKLTDKNQDIINLLRYHAWCLYGFRPESETPKKPAGYSDLDWAPHPCERCSKPELVKRLNDRIEKNPKSRIAIASSEFGWLFAPAKTP